ncbi:MAG: AraC family transcriptional regulator [Cytophagales bacterium]|nr:AraC family transcriptional regulator [Cytophagales bacterium]
MFLEENTNFIFSKPKNKYLQNIVLTYFYIHINASELFVKQEYIIPYPRVTFGFFFNNPFYVYNSTRNEIKKENNLVTKVTKDQIVVSPTTDKIQILGAHLKPFALALFTKVPISQLNWGMDPFEILGIKARSFEERLNKIKTVPGLFDLAEKSFLDALLVKDFDIIDKAIQLIDESDPLISVVELAESLHVTVRTLRNHFQKFIGCSPKDYLQIVRIKRATYKMYASDSSLTDTGFDVDFYDQSHFINSFQKTIGKGPKDIKKDIKNFRFLQF